MRERKKPQPAYRQSSLAEMLAPNSPRAAPAQAQQGHGATNMQPIGAAVRGSMPLGQQPPVNYMTAAPTGTGSEVRYPSQANPGMTGPQPQPRAGEGFGTHLGQHQVQMASSRSTLYPGQVYHAGYQGVPYRGGMLMPAGSVAPSSQFVQRQHQHHVPLNPYTGSPHHGMPLQGQHGVTAHNSFVQRPPMANGEHAPVGCESARSGSSASKKSSSKGMWGSMKGLLGVFKKNKKDSGSGKQRAEELRAGAQVGALQGSAVGANQHLRSNVAANTSLWPNSGDSMRFVGPASASPSTRRQVQDGRNRHGEALVSRQTIGTSQNSTLLGAETFHSSGRRTSSHLSSRDRHTGTREGPKPKEAAQGAVRTYPAARVLDDDDSSSDTSSHADGNRRRNRAGEKKATAPKSVARVVDSDSDSDSDSESESGSSEKGRKKEITVKTEAVATAPQKKGTGESASGNRCTTSQTDKSTRTPQPKPSGVAQQTVKETAKGVANRPVTSASSANTKTPAKDNPAKPFEGGLEMGHAVEGTSPVAATSQTNPPPQPSVLKQCTATAAATSEPSPAKRDAASEEVPVSRVVPLTPASAPTQVDEKVLPKDPKKAEDPNKNENRGPNVRDHSEPQKVETRPTELKREGSEQCEKGNAMKHKGAPHSLQGSRRASVDSLRRKCGTEEARATSNPVKRTSPPRKPSPARLAECYRGDGKDRKLQRSHHSEDKSDGDSDSSVPHGPSRRKGVTRGSLISRRGSRERRISGEYKRMEEHERSGRVDSRGDARSARSSSPSSIFRATDVFKLYFLLKQEMEDSRKHRSARLRHIKSPVRRAPRDDRYVEFLQEGRGKECGLKRSGCGGTPSSRELCLPRSMDCIFNDSRGRCTRSVSAKRNSAGGWGRTSDLACASSPRCASCAFRRPPSCCCCRCSECGHSCGHMSRQLLQHDFNEGVYIPQRTNQRKPVKNSANSVVGELKDGVRSLVRKGRAFITDDDARCSTKRRSASRGVGNVPDGTAAAARSRCSERISKSSSASRPSPATPLPERRLSTGVLSHRSSSLRTHTAPRRLSGSELVRHTHRLDDGSYRSNEYDDSAYAPHSASKYASWVGEDMPEVAEKGELDESSGPLSNARQRVGGLSVPVVDLRSAFRPRTTSTSGSNTPVRKGRTSPPPSDLSATLKKQWNREGSTPPKKTRRASSLSVTAAPNSRRTVDVTRLLLKELSSPAKKNATWEATRVFTGSGRQESIDSPLLRRRSVRRKTPNDACGNGDTSSSAVVVVEEVKLDEQKRPYVLIREIPLGAQAVEAQRLLSERLSKPKSRPAPPESIAV